MVLVANKKGSAPGQQKQSGDKKKRYRRIVGPSPDRHQPMNVSADTITTALSRRIDLIYPQLLEFGS